MKSQAADRDVVNPEASKALHGSIGAASPLWWAFAGAASAGVAYWWMTRWARPVNLEAMMPKAVESPALVESAAAYEMEPEALADIAEIQMDAAAEAATEIADMQVEAAAATVDAIEEAVASAAEVMPAPMTPDDLTLIVGIGPTLAANLAKSGVTSFAQIAAWTEEEIAMLDKELKLMGRVSREAWLDQAKALAAG